jgi:phosphohistidine swiveling domain-containing protein
MPVWETVEPAPMPSGEVAAIVGVGLAIPVTCAMAVALQRINATKAVAISGNLMVISF